MAEVEEPRGAAGGIVVPSTAGSLGEIPTSGEASTKSTRPIVIGNTFTTNVMIEGSKRSIVVVHRDTISKAEESTTDIFSSDDSMLRLPPRMSEWTKDDVRNWMKDCPALRELQAETFAEQVANGNSLISYKEANLQTKFGFTQKEVDCFVSSRNDWLTKENANKDYAFSRVSKIGKASTSGFQLNSIYNITLNNANDCIVFIGEGNQQGTGGRPFAAIPVNMHVKTNPEDSARKESIYKAIFEFMQRAAKQISIEHIKTIIKIIEEKGEYSLEKIERGCIRFIVRFYSKESLDKFNGRCLNGELAEKLTAYLTTYDDITQVSGKELKIHLTIKDTDYKEALKILQPSDLSSGAKSQAPTREEETKWAFGLRSLKKLKHLKLKDFSLDGDGLNKIAKSLMQLPDFVDLDVSGNPLGGSAKDWSSYLRTMTKLEKLNFSACNLTGPDAKSIGSMVRGKFELQLNLSGNTELGGSTEIWVNPFRRTKNLNKLGLNKCKVESSKVEEIISNLHQLEEFDLSSNRLGGSLALWAPALKKLNKLTKLVLRSCGLTAKDLQCIDAAIHELNVSGNHGIGNSVVSASLPKNLKNLDMSNCCLSVEALDQYVTDDASLVDINLSKNKDIITSALSKVIKKMKKLKKLSLSGCSLTDEYMEDILCACLQLIKLDISDNEGLRGTLSSWFGKVEEMTILQRLSLGSCNLSNEDVGQVVTNLKDAANFKELILSGNRDIGRKNLTIVADLYNLDTLDMSDCMLQENYMVHLLQQMDRLVKLIISKNHGLGGTLAGWAIDLRCLENLRELNLGFSSLQEGDVYPLVVALSTMENFNELCLAGNAEIGKSSVWLAQLRTMTLKKLDISGCSLTEMGIRVLLDYQGLGVQVKREPSSFQSSLEELDLSFHPYLGEALISHDTGTL